MMTSQGMFLYYEGDPANPNPIYETESSGVKLPSFLTDSFKTQQASSLMSDLIPTSDLTQGLDRLMLESIITRTLEAHGVELKEGDVLSMKLNGKGEFTINAKSSSIGDRTGSEISTLCSKLSNKLNETEVEEGLTLGKALLKQFSEDLEFDFDEVEDKANFLISFSFAYNSETGKSEIFGAKVGLMMLDDYATLIAEALTNAMEEAQNPDESIGSQMLQVVELSANIRRKS